MAGLIGALAAGALGGAGKGMSENAQGDIKNIYDQMNAEMKAEMEARIYERGRRDKAGDDAAARSYDIEKTGLVHKNRLEEIKAQAAAQSKAAKDPTEDEAKKFKLQQEKRKDAALQEWTQLAEQYDSATDESDKKYLYPLLQKAETKLAALGINPRGTTSVITETDPMGEDPVTKMSVKTGVKTQAPSSSQDKFIIGKQYKDANGNVATYRGNGQWE